MRSYEHLVENRIRIFIILLLLTTANCLYGQISGYSYFYRVYFKDKGSNYLSDFSPENFLSARALNRREKSGVPALSISDLPVNADYISSLHESGFNGKGILIAILDGGFTNADKIIITRLFQFR